MRRGRAAGSEQAAPEGVKGRGRGLSRVIGQIMCSKQKVCVCVPVTHCIGSICTTRLPGLLPASPARSPSTARAPAPGSPPARPWSGTDTIAPGAAEAGARLCATCRGEDYIPTLPGEYSRRGPSIPQRLRRRAQRPVKGSRAEPAG